MKRLLLPLLATLTACGGGTTTPPDTADFDLSLDKSSLNISAGGSASLTVSIVPTGGFNRDVDLTFVRVTAPVAVTGGFSLSPTKTNSQLTVNVDAVVNPGSYTLLVRGIGTVQGQPAKREKEVTLTVPASTTITVGGRVKNAFGNPLENATVRLSPSVSTTTNASGQFTLTNVQAPYDLTITPGGSTAEHIFQGISRADPNMLLFGFSGGTPLQASTTISGSLTAGAGVTFPNPANTVAQVAFNAPTALKTNFETTPTTNILALFAGGGPAYSNLSAQWTGNASIAGTLHALQWQVNPADALQPTSFLAYGSLDVNVSNGVGLSGRNIPMQAISSGALTASLGVPAGLTTLSRQLYVNLGPKTIFSIAANLTSPPSSIPNPANISWATPVIVGKTLTFAALATNPDGRSSSLQINGLQASQVVNPTLDPPAVLNSPTPGQSGVGLTSSLNWNNPAQRISIVLLNAPGVNRVYYKLGNSLSPALVGGKTYTWVVGAVGPFAGMDEFTGSTWVDGYPTFGWDKTFYTTTSASRTFSTP